MEYFETFPKIYYDIAGNGNLKLITDILRRFKVRNRIQEDTVMFDKYEVLDGERPEDVSMKFYGTPYHHWVVLSINNIKDRFYDWPLSNADFETYIENKYTNPLGIHHYEIAQSSGVTSSLDNSHLIEVNSDTSGASSVSNREFEQRIQDNKRLIKILRPEYLSEFIEEFKRTIQR
tara:strand:+ start:315 stop:842 length:528 start_codon:yes stop_codon:yes gene_type:complete